MEQFNKGYSTLFERGDPEQDGDEPVKHNGFAEHYGWIYNAKQVSEFEGVKLDDVFKMNVVHFLNDLGYLKAKQAHEKSLNARDKQ